MTKFKVKSGSMNVEIESEDHSTAVRQAILESNAEATLGIFLYCLKDGDSEGKAMICSTENLLLEMGILM